MVVVASDHGTIHVFNLEDNKPRESSLPIIPKYFSSQWSFVKFSIPQGPRCVCAFGADPNSVVGELELSKSSLGKSLIATFSLNQPFVQTATIINSYLTTRANVVATSVHNSLSCKTMRPRNQVRLLRTPLMHLYNYISPWKCVIQYYL